MRHLISLFFALWAAVFASSAWASKVALVIGNSDYEYVSDLENPRNDAQAISASLTDQGFDVTEILNLERRAFYDVLRDFRAKADAAEMAIVYFAGHGIEIAGVNYLVPVDAELRDERDAKVELVTVDTVLDQISGARRMKMIVLDACRNNPFAAAMRRNNTGRNIGRGLGKIETQQSGTVIAYAAAAGEITPDGASGGNSPFTSAFLKAMSGPPRDVRRFLGAVHDEMRVSVPGSAPAVYAQLGGGEYVINPLSGFEERQPVTSPDAERAKLDEQFLADYLTADELGTVDGWNSFLRTYASRREDRLFERGMARRSVLLGGGDVTAPTAPIVERAKKDVVRDLQSFLKERGCYGSSLDGIYGRQSARGVASYASVAGLDVSLPARPDARELEAALSKLKTRADKACPVRKRVPKPKPLQNARVTPTPSAPASTAPVPAKPVAKPTNNCIVFEGQRICN